MELIRRETDYAVRALLAIASSDGRIVPTAEIAKKQEVPYTFLQKILRKLVEAGIISVKRGTAGGFSLARPPLDVTLLEITESVQGPIALNRCFLGEGKCPIQKECSVRVQLVGAHEGIRELLAEVTLQELLDNFIAGQESTDGRRRE